MNAFLDTAAQKLGFRQSAYRQTFADGSPANLVLVDLANFSRAFDADIDGVSHDGLMMIHGRRQVFFRIVKHLKLTPIELEYVYQPAMLAAAARLQRTNQGDDNG